jgi:hypothetical protein
VRSAGVAFGAAPGDEGRNTDAHPHSPRGEELGNLRLSRTRTIADRVENLKTSSSNWLKAPSSDLAACAWQRGYGCCSVGPTDSESLCVYIDNLGEHHRARTFQDEFRMFPRKHGVE